MKTLDDAILAEARSKLVEHLMEAMGRFDAERMAGIFFEIPVINGETVAAFILKKARIAKE